MQCPHCLVEFHDQKIIEYLGEDSEGKWGIEKYECPNPTCKKSIYFLIKGDLYSPQHSSSYYIRNNKYDVKQLIRPKGSSRLPIPLEVPKDFSEDYNEACLIIADSPKASAALSRRCLQHILREKAGVKKSDLANEIQEVLDKNQLPSYIAESTDAVRNIGNFAAHPLKSKSTGEIVPVEVGEAEWTLDVLELLFDFYFVQPEKIKKKRLALNQKLNDAGKPDMK
ncbi:MAG: DUF4145 domain-containing protein [Bacteroidetes bacterium]|nr:DUF4145 domain-containing protein [Bacteroidota bacterium]